MGETWRAESLCEGRKATPKEEGLNVSRVRSTAARRPALDAGKAFPKTDWGGCGNP